MHVQIQVKGLPGSSQLRRFASQKLDLALARFAHAIQDATMRLADINGPDRGGVDKLCRVVLTMKNDTVVVIEDLGTDVAQVICRVAERLHRNVGREFSRLAEIDRGGLRPQTIALAAT